MLRYLIRHMRKTIFLLALQLFSCMAFAEYLKVRVVDAETGEPLQGAKVLVYEVIPGVCISYQHRETDSLGYFYHGCAKNWEMKFTVSYFGYHNGTTQWLGKGGKEQILLDEVKLKPSEAMLKEVRVKGKVPRFYMRGDTVIFNPEAFRMEKGDKLISLVKKLPGVSIRDGQLLWNDSPLILMMNGKEALNEAMMLQLLPAEAVGKIKAYERTSELQDRTGVADGKQKKVLDVIIKPGFMDKIYGSVESKAYAGKEYAARADATRLSDENPFMAMVRVADDPIRGDGMSINGMGYSSSNLPIRQQAGALAYRHLWKPQFKVYRDSRWDITAGANHWDETQGGWENQLTFIPGSMPTLSTSTNHAYDHNLRIPVNFDSNFNLAKKTVLGVNANLSYMRERKSYDSKSETLEAEGLGALVNASDYQSGENQDGISMNANAKLGHYLPKGMLTADMKVSYEDTQHKGSSLGEYQYAQLDSSSTDCQRFESPQRKFRTSWGLGIEHALGKRVVFSAMWDVIYARFHRDEQRWRNDTPDWNNSTFRQDDNWINAFTTYANYEQGRFSMRPVLYLEHRHEQTEYRRAALDTLARRNLIFARPSLELSYSLKQQMRLQGTLSYVGNPADMIESIGYVDNTNPLFVRMGNPHLITSHWIQADLSYTMMLTKHSQSLSVSGKFQKQYDPIGTVLHYNSQTGAYRMQQQNVRGGSTWSGKISYDRTLTDDLQIRNTISENYEHTYGIMTLVDDATGKSSNRQAWSKLKDNLTLSYHHGNWSVSSAHTFSWSLFTYSNALQNTRNVFHFDTELRTRYKLKGWGFTLAPMYIYDRGYASSRMNGNQFLLNAQVDYSMLKNRARLTLEGNDLLNQKKLIYSDITATTHTEGGQQFLHQYVSLTFTYNFDTRKKSAIQKK